MKDLHFRVEEPKLLSQEITDTIKAAIIKGKFRPGEKISEAELAESLGISRTPLREAFRRLESEGFITITPRKGAVVSEIDPREAYDLYVIKSALEGVAARLAVGHLKERDLEKLERINEELKVQIRDDDLAAYYRTHPRFHEVFIRACENPRLIQMLGNLNDHFKRFGHVSLALPGRFRNTIRQHEEIIAAFRKGDERGVEEKVRENVLTGGIVLVEHLKERDKENDRA